MNGSFYILSDKAINIKRFHICTWDAIDAHGAVEIGLEFTLNAPTHIVNFKLISPFLIDSVKCMKDALLGNGDNCKFIFNDKISSVSHIKNDKTNGAIVTFEARNKLAILPVCDLQSNQNCISFSIKNVQQTQGVTNYARLWIVSKDETIALTQSGITKTSYVYDVKLNEKRNIPQELNEIENKGFSLCKKIEQCFAFHVIPSNFQISYINSNHQKGIRILEASAFNNYLGCTGFNKLRPHKYIITFCKDKKDSDCSYSFYTTFDKEIIGYLQVVLAVGANILCSLLFAISSLDTKGDAEWYNQIPISFWLAIAILMSLVIYVGYKSYKK